MCCPTTALCCSSELQLQAVVPGQTSQPRRRSVAQNPDVLHASAAAVWCMQVLTKCCRHWRSGRTVAGVAGAEGDGAGVEAGAEGLAGRNSGQADTAGFTWLSLCYHFRLLVAKCAADAAVLGDCLAAGWPIVLCRYVGGPCEHPLEPLAHWLVPRSGLRPNYCTVPSYNHTRALATARGT